MFKESNKIAVILIIYLISILLFTYFSNTVSFHDTYEYITLTKEFAGIHNVNVYSTHSLIYNFLSAPIVKIFNNFFIIKLLSSIWIFLIGLLIFLYSRNKNALLLWIFSPLAWFMSIQYIPILPASFFLLLGYVLFKKYDINKSRLYFIISAISMGFSSIIYFPSLVVVIFFLATFLWRKKFYEVLIYLIFILFGMLPEFVLNNTFFGLPFYSFIRYFGINMVVILGKSPFKVDFIYYYWLFIPVVISPLLYKLINIDFKRVKSEIVFLFLCILFFGLRGGSINYFLLFSPILILLISKGISKKELLVSSIISIFIITLMTYSYFGKTFDERVMNDLNKIKSEHPLENVLTGNNRAIALATFSWDNEPKFIWSWEYDMESDNKTITSEYELKSKPMILSDKILVLNSRLEKANHIDTNDIKYLIIIKGEKVPNGFELIDEYDILSLYKRSRPY